MARERGLGREVHDCVRVARQQMARDGETTGDVAEALPVLGVQEERADAGRPNGRHGRPSARATLMATSVRMRRTRPSVNDRPNNNPIRTTASLKPRAAAGRGQGPQVVYHL